MWNYEKRLEYPVNITTPNPKIAQIIMSQYGGPDGEMGASMRYLSQRFTAPNRIVAGVLNDVGTEELAHLDDRNTEIDEELTKEEVYSNSIECQKLSTERAANEARLEELYELWEELAE